MRSLGATVAAIAATLVAIVAIPLLWAQFHLIDRDGFVDLGTPLAARAEVKTAIGNELINRITSQSDIPRAVITPIVRDYTETEIYRTAFANVLGQEHDWLFTEPQAGQQTQVMELDLTDMAEDILTHYRITGIHLTGPVKVPVSESVRSGLAAGRYHNLGKWGLTISIGLVVATAVLSLLALLIARRRAVMLLVLGIGGIAAAGIGLWLNSAISDRIRDEVVGADAAPREVAYQFIDHAGGNLQHWTWIVMGGYGVVAAIALAAIAIAGPGRSAFSR